MKIIKNSTICFLLSWVAIILSVSSCHKETNTTKLSSKSCFVVPLYIKGAFISDGEPFFLGWDHKEVLVNSDLYVSHGNMSRISLNPLNGNFSEITTNYSPILPNNTTLSTGINQLKPNSNSFILNSEFTYFDTAGNSYKYTKLYLADKNVTLQKEFKLVDSSIIVNSVEQMADGRYVIAYTDEKIKKISCYSNNLTMDWTRTVEFGSFPKDFDHQQVLVSSKYIYVLQVGRYITKNYCIYQYDYEGRKLFTYELNSQTNKFTAGQLIESPNGFYSIGTKYLSEKSDYDISISTMSSANKLLTEHGLNITEYLPDWNTAAKNVFNTYYSGLTSYAIKTATGYAFTICYPDNKNNNCLALVILNDQMKVESVKQITKMVRDSNTANQINNLFFDGNRFYIILANAPNYYFYTLDKEGSLVK
jgi:hypothetical protein